MCRFFQVVRTGNLIVVLQELIREELVSIHYKLDKLTRIGQRNMALIDDVVLKVEEQTAVVASVETLLVELKTMLDNAGTDIVKLQAVKDTLEANTAKLAAAVVANTPVVP